MDNLRWKLEMELLVDEFAMVADVSAPPFSLHCPQFPNCDSAGAKKGPRKEDERAGGLPGHAKHARTQA